MVIWFLMIEGTGINTTVNSIVIRKPILHTLVVSAHQCPDVLYICDSEVVTHQCDENLLQQKVQILT